MNRGMIFQLYLFMIKQKWLSVPHSFYATGNALTLPEQRYLLQAL